MQALVVERGRAEQPDLLLRREQQLDPRVRPVSASTRRVALEHRRDRRLVVGAEDRPAGVPHDAVLDHRLDRALGRHGVEVRAEEDRRPRRRRLEAAEDVAHRRADLRPGVVLVDGRAEIAQVAGDDVGDRALLARRARDRRELGEEVEDLRGMVRS